MKGTARLVAVSEFRSAVGVVTHGCLACSFFFQVSLIKLVSRVDKLRLLESIVVQTNCCVDDVEDGDVQWTNNRCGFRFVENFKEETTSRNEPERTTRPSAISKRINTTPLHYFNTNARSNIPL